MYYIDFKPDPDAGVIRLDYQLRNGETTSYGYDNNYRLNWISIKSKHSQGITYDKYDRIIQSNDTVDGSKVFIRKTDYDVLGRISKETYPSGYSITNQYDKYGYPTGVTGMNGANIWQALESNAKGQLTKSSQGGRETIFGFDSLGFPSSITDSGIINMSYSFNSKGNLDYRQDNLTGYKETFNYDATNRLLNWSIYKNNVLQKSDNVTFSDTTGNIATKSDIGNFAMRYGEDGNPPHALTSISGVPTVFPADNLTVTYTDFKKIKALTEGAKTYTLSYGVDEQRIKSVYAVNGVTQMTRYYLGDYEEEVSSTGSLRKIHFLGNGAIYINNNGTDSLLFTYNDYLGSPVALTDYNGSVIEKYAFDPWGNRRNPSDWTQKDTRTSWRLNRGYTGHEHLDAFGIINMNGRVYDPLIAQFFSPDPYVQAPSDWLNFNRYAYCLNNPLIYVDENGEFFLTWNISKKGFSIGLNFGLFGFGINVGWSDGGSIGVYGELGPRVGGTGFGSGATISQSLDFSFRSGSFSTTTSAGVYGSLDMFNAGGNASYTYGKQGGFNWGISAGINLFGNDAWGVGLNVGYGSGGWTYGLGGYYDSKAWKDNPVYEPDKWNDGGDVYYDEYGHIVDYDPTTQLTNNCYSYALDDIDNGNLWGLQPGGDGGMPITNASDITLEYVTNAAISDGRVKQPNLWNKLGFGKNGYYEVYLVIDQGKDYHWYRQDKGGNWSHKPGITPVRNVDYSGRLITNPIRANHGSYQNGGRRLWVRR